MEKLSEEMFEKLEQVIADTISSERMAAKIMRGLDEAGILAPAETPKMVIGIAGVDFKSGDVIYKNENDDRFYKLPSAETPYEKARRLWSEWEREPDGGITYEAACQIVPPLLAEIDRRDREAWTDEDMRYTYIFGVNYGCGIRHISFDEWITARRAAKAKE